LGGVLPTLEILWTILAAGYALVGRGRIRL